MNHFTIELFILYVFCTLQLQTHLLIMESKPSTNTVTSTEQDPCTVSVSGKKESDETPTSSTPNPAPTSVVQKYVTDAAKIIASSPTFRRKFITEVSQCKKCIEAANEKKRF